MLLKFFTYTKSEIENKNFQIWKILPEISEIKEKVLILIRPAFDFLFFWIWIIRIIEIRSQKISWFDLFTIHKNCLNIQ